MQKHPKYQLNQSNKLLLTYFCYSIAIIDDANNFILMTAEEKCKICLSRLFSFEFATDCINENDSVSEENIALLKKMKKLPNNLFDEKFDVELLRQYVDSDSSFEELVTLIEVQRSVKIFCGKCSRVVSQTTQCKRCLMKYHQKCFGTYKICYFCNDNVQKGKFSEDSENLCLQQTKNKEI
jgi:hypothetical protein